MKTLRSEEWINVEENINIGKFIATHDEPIHKHDFLEITYIVSGDGVQYVDGNEYKVKKGDMIFINCTQTHSFTTNKEMTYVNFLLNPEFMSNELVNSENLYDVFSLSIFDEFRNDINMTCPVVRFYGKEIVELEQIIEYMISELAEKKPGYKSILKGYMSVVFSKLLRNLKTSVNADEFLYVDKIAAEILDYINQNSFEKMTVEDISKKFFYNPSYFSKVFKKCYGMSPATYIRERRIVEAKRLLVETDLSVAQIYESLGYIDKTQFYKNFKNSEGMTPGMFRKAKKTT